MFSDFGLTPGITIYKIKVAIEMIVPRHPHPARNKNRNGSPVDLWAKKRAAMGARTKQNNPRKESIVIQELSMTWSCRLSNLWRENLYRSKSGRQNWLEQERHRISRTFLRAISMPRMPRVKGTLNNKAEASEVLIIVIATMVRDIPTASQKPNKVLAARSRRL